jgi:hypothetical protein
MLVGVSRDARGSMTRGVRMNATTIAVALRAPVPA